MSNTADSEDDRTTAQGLFNYADSYLGVAHAAWVAQPKVPFPDEPVRFLLYHAAELHLKAFLRCAGTTVDDLREVGHRFTKLIGAARTHKLWQHSECEAVLIYGQRTGDVIDSRYVRTGYRRWYDTETLGRCAASVRKRCACIRSARGKSSCAATAPASLMTAGNGPGTVSDLPRAHPIAARGCAPYGAPHARM